MQQSVVRFSQKMKSEGQIGRAAAVPVQHKKERRKAKAKQNNGRESDLEETWRYIYHTYAFRKENERTPQLNKTEARRLDSLVPVRRVTQSMTQIQLVIAKAPSCLINENIKATLGKYNMAEYTTYHQAPTCISCRICENDEDAQRSTYRMHGSKDGPHGFYVSGAERDPKDANWLIWSVLYSGTRKVYLLPTKISYSCINQRYQLHRKLNYK